MARTLATGRLPRGTNIIFSAFMEAMGEQPDKWQKVAGQAAIAKLQQTLKAMPTYQDPKESKATTRRGSSSASSSSKKSASATKRTTRSATSRRGSTASGTRRGASSGTTAESANSSTHPDQQA